MTVLAGEGEFSILYGPRNLPAGTQIRQGYLARPDVPGEFPVVLVVHDIFGLGSNESDLCRRLARHGFAALAIDLYRGRGPASGASLEEAVEASRLITRESALADLERALRFAVNPETDWSIKESVGVLGLDVGGRAAIRMAAARPDAVRAVAVAYSPMTDVEEEDPPLSHALERLKVPFLALHGDADELVPVDDVAAARDLVGGGEFVTYQGVGHDFLDATRDGYHPGAAADALGRLLAFFRSSLPAARPIVYG